MELALVIVALIAIGSAVGATACRVWGIEDGRDILRVILDVVIALLLGFSPIIFIVLLDYFHLS